MIYFPLLRRSPGFRPGSILWLCVLALALPALAQTNGVSGLRANRPASERFLLIVETSAAMQKRAVNVQTAIGRLFSSGVNGQLDPGDSIGVWTYDSDLHTGQFPLQRWTPQTGRQITGRVVQFIQQQPYGKQSRLAPVMAQLTNVVADSEKITVILVSEGSEAPVGTTFDEQIAEAFKLNAAEQRRQSMPFVTILRAVKGKFVSLRVNTPPWPIELPAYPNEPELTGKIPVTNSTPAKVEVVPTPPVTPVVPEPPPRPPETNLVESPNTNPPVVVEATPPPVTIPSNPPPTPAVVVTSKPVQTVAAPAKDLTTNPPPAISSGPTTSTTTSNTLSKLPLLPILIGAGVVFVGVIILCLVILKRSRAEPRVSLITRSMNKDGN